MRLRIIVVTALTLTCLELGYSATDLEHLEGSVVKLRCSYPVFKNVDGKDYESWLKDPQSGTLLREQRTAGGTGFLLQSSRTTYIVTARHVAVEMGIDTVVTARAPSNMPVDINLRDLVSMIQPNGTPRVQWLVHSNADCAIIEITSGSTGFHKLSHAYWTSQGMLETERIAPQKVDLLTVFGFALGYGAEFGFSPITLEMKAASGLREEGGVDYFFLQNPGIAGLSGAPFFRSGAPRVVVPTINSLAIAYGQSRCWGLLSRTDGDASGGKMARIIHSRHIDELLNQYERQFVWRTNLLPVAISDSTVEKLPQSKE